MKFTVLFVTLLSISAPWLVMGKKADEQKDKREAPVSYASSAGHSSSSYQPSQAYQSSQSYQPSQAYQSSQAYQPSQVYQAAQTYEPASAGHGDANAISVGAGYSIGGTKPSYSFGGQGGLASLQIPSDGLQSSGHNTIQLPPITLQPGRGAGLVGTDLNQLMSQLSQSLNTGALSLQPSNSVAEFHSGGEGAHGAQELNAPRYSYPKLQQYSLGGALGAGSYAAGAPSFAAATPTFTATSPLYATGSKGLSSYGSTGPVLFNPSEGQSAASGLSYASLGSGNALGDSGALSLGGSGHALSGLTLGGSGNSFEGSLKSLGIPSKSFTPSVFLGASSDSSHGLAGAGGSYNNPSFEGIAGGQSGLSLSSGAHGPTYAGSFNGFGGDTKFAAPSFGSFKSDGYSSPSEALAAFSANGHSSSPSGANYGFATSSYPGGPSHAASAAKPYYVSSSKYPSGGSSSFRGPSSSHSSLNSHSSGPKYSFGGHSSARYSPKDAYGAHSETSYNTIKYSAELKPRVH